MLTIVYQELFSSEGEAVSQISGFLKSSVLIGSSFYALLFSFERLSKQDQEHNQNFEWAGIRLRKGRKSLLRKITNRKYFHSNTEC